MIAYLRGNLYQRDLNDVVIDVNGVGYRVAVSLQTSCKLPEPGEHVELLIHTHVREDQLDLYGFLLEKERRLFRFLMSVNGIGAKSALSILSGIPTDELIELIRDGDSERLTKVQGIGQKTAERVILELKDKINKYWAKSQTEVYATRSDVREDVISALVNLGYRAKDAEVAVTRILVKDEVEFTFKELLKQTLGNMR